VPKSFVITQDDEWEADLWGITLGNAVQLIRNKNTYKQYRPELEEMGFDFDRQD
jgi:hypothetical protein